MLIQLAAKTNSNAKTVPAFHRVRNATVAMTAKTDLTSWSAKLHHSRVAALENSDARLANVSAKVGSATSTSIAAMEAMKTHVVSFSTFDQSNLNLKQK